MLQCLIHPLSQIPVGHFYLAQNMFTLFYSDAKALVRTALEASRAARSHAMDARLTKQPITPQLHTTAGLIATKSAMVRRDLLFFQFLN
jgi:hypothetical protein